MATYWDKNVEGVWTLNLEEQSKILNTSNTYVPVDIKIEVKDGNAIINARQELTVSSQNISVSRTGSIVSLTINQGAVEVHGTKTAGWIDSGTIEEDVTIVGTKSITLTDLDANLTASNIRYGKNVLGVDGSFTSAETVSAGQTAANAAHIITGKSAWVNGAEVMGSMGTATFSTNYFTTTAASGISASKISRGEYTGDSNDQYIKAGVLTNRVTTNTSQPSIGSAGWYTEDQLKIASYTISDSSGSFVITSEGEVTVNQYTTTGMAAYQNTIKTPSAGKYIIVPSSSPVTGNNIYINNTQVVKDSVLIEGSVSGGTIAKKASSSLDTSGTTVKMVCTASNISKTAGYIAAGTYSFDTSNVDTGITIYTGAFE